MAAEETGEPKAAAEAAPPAPPPLRASPGGLAALRVLRHREFAIFWVGQAISLTGTWMQNFAQGWVVASITEHAIALGMLNFAMALPTLLLMPMGGVAADRMDRRRILILTQWLMLVLAAITAVLIARDGLELWHLYVIALFLGVATAYELPAYQSFYPQLIDREDLPGAIALNQATFNGSRIIGPALASAVVALWGLAAAFFANAASFLGVIVSLSLVRPRPPAAGKSSGSGMQMMREGIAYVRERPVMQALLGITAVTTFFVFPNLAVLMPFYAKHVIKVGEGGLGLLMSLSGLGSLIGSILLLQVAPERRVPRILLAAGTVGVTLSVLAWSQWLWLSVAAVILQSLALSFSIGVASVMMQEMVPNQLRGRVMSLYTLMFTGIMPFAALAITGLADAIGMRLELQIAAILYAAGMLFMVIRLGRGVRESAEAESAVAAP